MMLTPTLFDRRASIQDRFEAFHAENPHIIDELERLAADAFSRGHVRIGMKALFEVLRWSRTVETGADDFKLNNDFSSRYARLLVDRRPDWRERFEQRELRS